MSRKITFPNVGVEQGSRVWRNAETGVEIIKGKNFAEVGLYYVCTPVAPSHPRADMGRLVVAPCTTLKAAREVATLRANALRQAIGQAYDTAVDEAIERRCLDAEQAEAQMDQIDAWWRRHGIHGSTNYTASILAAREIDHAEALTEHSSRYWEQATDGMPRVPAFG